MWGGTEESDAISTIMQPSGEGILSLAGMGVLALDGKLRDNPC